MENAEAKPRTPAINIVVENFVPDRADDYGRRWMMPLIRAALQELEGTGSVSVTSDKKGPG